MERSGFDVASILLFMFHFWYHSETWGVFASTKASDSLKNDQYIKFPSLSTLKYLLKPDTVKHHAKSDAALYLMLEPFCEILSSG